MPEIDPTGHRITFKLVYYGPAQSGKTTNLMRLHDLLQPEMKGELMTLETRDDRTLFFDLLPLGFSTASGWLLRFRLFTVPGQVAHDGTRKAVLSRADGVVFVADSRRSQAVNNGESFQNLADNAARAGLDFSTLPLVVQYNKQDLPDILSEAEIRGRYAGAPWPLVLASALDGRGVTETLARLLECLHERYDAELGLSREHGLSAPALIRAVLGEIT